MACAVRQQAITWANIDPGFCRHMTSLGHNELGRPTDFCVMQLQLFISSTMHSAYTLS